MFEMAIYGQFYLHSENMHEYAREFLYYWLLEGIRKGERYKSIIVVYGV